MEIVNQRDDLRHLALTLTKQMMSADDIKIWEEKNGEKYVNFISIFEFSMENVFKLIWISLIGSSGYWNIFFVRKSFKILILQTEIICHRARQSYCWL